VAPRPPGSIRSDAHKLHHPAPFIGFVGDELSKVGRRADKRCASEVGQLRLGFGIGEAGVDLFVELNKEQVKSAVRWFGATFGGAIAGFFVAKGWLTADQVMSILTSEVFVGVVATAAQLPEVTRIEVTDRKPAADVKPTVDATVTTAPPPQGR
jgi:hypothetical protein